MSVFNFLLLVTDYLMRRTTSGASNGVIGSFTNKLDDLDFPDDKALIWSTIKQCQAIVNKLKEISTQTGLKTTTVRFKVRSNAPIKLGEEEIEEVKQFTYLESTMAKSGGNVNEMKKRTGKAWAAFNKLKAIWQSNKSSVKKLYWLHVLTVYCIYKFQHEYNTIQYNRLYLRRVTRLTQWVI